MGNRNEVSSGGSSQSGIGAGRGRWANVKLPELRFGCVLALKDNIIVVTDGDRGSSEGHIASGITKLSNG